MSTMTAVAATGARPASVPTRSASFKSFVHAEWIKLYTVRSTTYTLLTAAIVAIGVGAFACQRLAAELGGGAAPIGPHGEVGGIDGISRSLIGGIGAQLAIGALGVLVVTSEFGTGMIRASVTAMPQRGEWIAAKLAVFGGVALVVGQLITFTSFGVGQAILAAQHGGASLSDPNALRSVVATGIYLSLIGLMGAALGLIIRHTAGALSTLLGAMFVLPAIAGAFPVGVQNATDPYLPESIRQQAAAAHPIHNSFQTWGGIGLMIGYVAVLTAVGVWTLKRRDA